MCGAHTFQQRKVELCEFKASLVSRASFRRARIVCWDIFPGEKIHKCPREMNRVCVSIKMFWVGFFCLFFFPAFFQRLVLQQRHSLTSQFEKHHSYESLCREFSYLNFSPDGLCWVTGFHLGLTLTSHCYLTRLCKSLWAWGRAVTNDITW